MANIAGLYPKAMCNMCGWIGSSDQLTQDVNGDPTVECCPECDSDDTEWLTIEEYDQILDDENLIDEA